MQNDPGQHDTAKPETAQPDTAQPDTAQPDTAAHSQPTAEASTPALVEVDPTLNCYLLFARRVQRRPAGTIIEEREGNGWKPVTAMELAGRITAVAKGLVGLGIQPGDRVAIMSRNRPEWTIMDYAIWQAGAVSVPIYESSSAEQVHWICSNSGAVAVLVETPEHLATVRQAAKDLPELRYTWTLETGGLAEISGAGAAVSDEELDRRAHLATLDDLATIIYTSGTTGRPKGAELTHGNFVVLTENVIEYLPQVTRRPGGSRSVFFLPLAHVFARMIAVLVMSCENITVGYAPDTKTLVQDFETFHPTFILGVPRVFEKVYNSAEQTAGSGLKLKIFRWAAKVAIVYSRALDNAGGPGPWLRLQHAVAGRLVYRRLYHVMGGAMEYAISGGAPLGERLGHFYRGIGLSILEGYGLTETTAPTAVNPPAKVKIGTVGPPIPGTSIRIGGDGEIQAKGPHIFRGYHDNPEASAAAFDGPWFRTGDIGSLDSDGYLQITGRMKEIIVTAGGKNVAPAVLEDRLRGHPIVSQCVVVGDQKPFIGALITLDAEMLPRWLANHGLPRMTVAEAKTNPQVLSALQRAVDRANQAVSRAESIRKFVVLDGDFTEANGYLTPSLKVKRARVLRDFQADIDSIYDTAKEPRDHEGR